MIYCQRCTQELSLARDNRCPKCGRLFDRTNPRTFNTSQDPSLYRPWYFFTRHPLLWTLAAVITALTTVVAGNGIAPLGYHVFDDITHHVNLQSLPNLYLAALWAILLLPLVAFRKPGTLRNMLNHSASPLFMLAIPAAVVANIAFDPQTPLLQHVIPGLAWPALCLYTLAAATDWHPFFRTAPCFLVCALLAAYWYFTVFPPPPAPAALHPITFIASVPFFASLLIPIALPLWFTIRSRKKPGVSASKTASPPSRPSARPR